MWTKGQQKYSLTVNSKGEYQHRQQELPDYDEKSFSQTRHDWIPSGLTERSSFLGLIATTVVSAMLLVTNIRNIVLSEADNSFILKHRAIVQFGVQLLANFLGLMQIIAL